MFNNFESILKQACSEASEYRIVVTCADHELLHTGRELWRNSDINGKRVRIVAIKQDRIAECERRCKNGRIYFQVMV